MEISKIMQLPKTVLQKCLDRNNGGYYHRVSENWDSVKDSVKSFSDHLILGRMFIFSAFATGDVKRVQKGEEIVNFAISKFEDKKNKGFFSVLSEDWSSVLDDTKHTFLIASSIGPVLHLYEYTLKEEYLSKLFEIMDLVLTNCRDNENGGFYDSFKKDWTIKSDEKSLQTQVSVLQALNGCYKDGIDSTYAKKAEEYKKEAEELANLILQKMYDKEYGGFFQSCDAKWVQNNLNKDVQKNAKAITALIFHYNTIGPVVFGPRIGSHAYTGRPIWPWYSYVGPAPNIEPISTDAYTFGKAAAETVDCLLQKAIDTENGGFYGLCSRKWAPVNREKDIVVQSTSLVALNMFYRLSGFDEVREKTAVIKNIVENKAWDFEYNGFYKTFSQSWEPLSTDKFTEVNIELPGAITMIETVLSRPPIPKFKPRIWIKPRDIRTREGETVRLVVVVQNQSFVQDRVRIGGLTSFSRWISPSNYEIDLKPHEVGSFEIQLTSPRGLAGKSYPFEITAISLNDASQYSGATATITITK
jgi:mannose/cellobiose epimerase-like protein (N-acyl-D-glucosamine 2-epimerase family)